MTDSVAELRQALQDARSELTKMRAALARRDNDLVAAHSETSTIRKVLGVEDSAVPAVAELFAYASRAARVDASMTDAIARLRQSQDAEARSIGNSLDVLFKATPVPKLIRLR